MHIYIIWSSTSNVSCSLLYQCFTDSFELLKQGRTVILKRELRLLAVRVFKS